MLPKIKYITISDNESKIIQMLNDLILQPRIKALEWSKITKQTPNMKIGYPGQHLASLALGMEGVKTGARGNDIIDGSEVKSCSRVDQLDTCKDCGGKVLRIEENCPNCNSSEIKRMDDSKWLFTIRNENDLNVLLNEVDRIVLTIADYPTFEHGNFEDIRFQIFEIWTKSSRCVHFRTLMNNYYNKIYLEHIRKNPNKVPAPKNFWPYSFQFYMCNPVKIFSCTVKNANTKPIITIDHFIDPVHDRSFLVSENMPSDLLNIDEFKIIGALPSRIVRPQCSSAVEYDNFIAELEKVKPNLKNLKSILPFVNEDIRKSFELRDTDKISESKQPYHRK